MINLPLFIHIHPVEATLKLFNTPLSDGIFIIQADPFENFVAENLQQHPTLGSVVTHSSGFSTLQHSNNFGSQHWVTHG